MMEIAFLPSTMFVYPGNRVSPQGRHNYSFVKNDGTSIPANRTFARQAEKRYCFPLSPDGMKINTGLDELVDNPFQNEEFAKKYIKDQWFGKSEELKAKEQITRQTYLEVLHNRPPGTYTNEKKVFKALDADARENNFFESYSVALQDTTNVFTADTLDGVLAMLCMKVNPSIAPSKAEYNPSFHDFYIGQEHEAAVETANRRQKQSSAIAKLANIKDESDTFILYQIATVLRLVNGPVSPVIVNDKLDDFLWNQDKTLNDRLKRFEELVKGINTQEGRERLYLRYVFQSALNTHIISIANGNFLWHTKRNIPNLYNLGTKESAILNMFSTEMSTYNPDLPVENFYGDLIMELKYKGVRLIENYDNRGAAL